MSFDEIAGQRRVKSILRAALRRGRVPHALLFVGPPGVGKRRTAVVLAQALNCLERRDDACGACPSCRAIENGNHPKEKGIHPDVIEIVLEKNKSGEPKSELSIDQFRDLKQLAYLRPFIGRRRVFFWKVDLMSSDAVPSILKVLEEPPATTTLILTSENPDLVLPTIKSRCQTLVFGPVAGEEIARALRGRGLDEERARLLALVLRGNLDKALELDADEVDRLRAETWSFFSGLAADGGSAAFLRRFAFRRRKEVKDDLAEALDLIGAFARDLVLLQEGGPARLLLNPDYQAQLGDLAARAVPGTGLKLLAAVAGARAGLDRKVQPGLLVSAFAARMIG